MFGYIELIVSFRAIEREDPLLRGEKVWFEFHRWRLNDSVSMRSPDADRTHRSTEHRDVCQRSAPCNHKIMDAYPTLQRGVNNVVNMKSMYRLTRDKRRRKLLKLNLFLSFLSHIILSIHSAFAIVFLPPSSLRERRVVPHFRLPEHLSCRL